MNRGLYFLCKDTSNDKKWKSNRLLVRDFGDKKRKFCLAIWIRLYQKLVCRRTTMQLLMLIVSLLTSEAGIQCWRLWGNKIHQHLLIALQGFSAIRRNIKLWHRRFSRLIWLFWRQLKTQVKRRTQCPISLTTFSCFLVLLLQSSLIFRLRLTFQIK